MPSEHKTQLFTFKTFLDHENDQLTEISRQRDAMNQDLPKDINGLAFQQLENYLRYLRETLKTCEALRKTIDKRLKEME